MATTRWTVSDRIRFQLHELFAQRPHGFKKLVADKLGMASATVTPWAAGERTPDYDQLEKICDMLGVKMSELIAEPGSGIYELNGDEATIIRALRGWPLPVRRALATFLLFFSNEEPAAGQTRNMFELWRHLDARARLAVYGFAVDKSQGVIPPEIEAELFEGLSIDAKAAVGRQQDRSRKERRNRP